LKELGPILEEIRELEYDNLVLGLKDLIGGDTPT
jgi:hypothetical protein